MTTESPDTIAKDIATAARGMGYRVTFSLHRATNSAYLFCNGIKIRVGNHGPSIKDRSLILDVHLGDNNKRPGAISADEAIAWLRTRIGGRAAS